MAKGEVREDARPVYRGELSPRESGHRRSHLIDERFQRGSSGEL